MRNIPVSKGYVEHNARVQINKSQFANRDAFLKVYVKQKSTKTIKIAIHVLYMYSSRMLHILLVAYVVRILRSSHVFFALYCASSLHMICIVYFCNTLLKC